MKKIKLILLFAVGFAFSTQLLAQAGGPKREKYHRFGKRRGNFLHKTWKSAGHADEFAKGSNGRFTKYNKFFKKAKPAWRYHRSGSVTSANRANRYLLTRWRTQGEKDNTFELYRIKKKRDRNRVRGSSVFRRSRDYKSRN